MVQPSITFLNNDTALSHFVNLYQTHLSTFRVNNFSWFLFSLLLSDFIRSIDFNCVLIDFENDWWSISGNALSNKILSPQMEIWYPYDLLQNGLLLICSIAANLINSQSVWLRNITGAEKWTDLFARHWDRQSFEEHCSLATLQKSGKGPHFSSW